MRGIAAGAVLVQHLLGHVWRASPADMGWLKIISVDYFDWGRFGVVLFFLTSGYVIPLSFSGTTPVRKFVVSRFFRLYPAFWLSVLAMAAVLWIGGAAASSRQILANLTMAYPAFGEPAIIGVYWTLIVELLFYALAAALFIVRCLDRPLVLGGIALVAIASAAGPMSANAIGYSLPVTFLGYHVSFLLLGSLIRLALNRVPRAKVVAFGVGIAIAATLPIVTGMLTGETSEYSWTPLGAMTAIGAAVGLFLLFWTERMMKQPAWLIALGAWSYSMYLFHEPIGEALKRFVVIDSPFTGLVFLTLASVLTVVVSAVIYGLVEKPAIRLGRRLVPSGKIPPSSGEFAP